MGPNLTEKALQNASRSVSSIHAICKKYDKQSGVPLTTSAHSTRSDEADIRMATQAVLTNELLHIVPDRHHRAFKTMRLNPVWNFDKKKALEWIEKKKEFQKFDIAYAEEDEVDEDEVDVDAENEDDDYEYYYGDSDDECLEETIAEYAEDDYYLF